MKQLLLIPGTGRIEKKSKPKGNLLPQVIGTAEKLIRRGYPPEQMANTVLKGQASTYRWLYAGFLL